MTLRTKTYQFTRAELVPLVLILLFQAGDYVTTTFMGVAPVGSAECNPIAEWFIARNSFGYVKLLAPFAIALIVAMMPSAPGVPRLLWIIVGVSGVPVVVHLMQLWAPAEYFARPVLAQLAQIC
jgi:predicted membrane channel-forming protein YqfA (hemolysin III family)